MKITFFNKGLSAVEVEHSCSIIDAIKISNPKILSSACAAIVDGELMDLRIKLAKDAAIEILDTESQVSLSILRHRLKLPYALIVGKNEQETAQVSVWNRGAGDVGAMSINSFINIILETINTKSVKPL